MRKMRWLRTYGALLMALILALSLTPLAVFAEEEGNRIASPLLNSPEENGVIMGGFLLKPESGCDFSYDNKVLTLRGGSMTLSTPEQTEDRIVVEGDASLTLTGANIAAEGGPAIEIKPGASLRLTAEGTNTLLGGSKYAGIGVGYRYLGDGGAELGSLVIDGTGSLNCYGKDEGAGIGGSDGYENACRGKHGNITINGATVYAKGAGRSAGIGSSNNFWGEGKPSASYKPDSAMGNWGSIVINGGSVTAEGVGNGAGIGGGNHNDSGVIIINGGTVNASGDSGIGSGLGSSKGADKGPGHYFADITITGGDITAYATDNMGAGIGGGMYCDAVITISGGTVRASVNTGGKPYQSGAGIGGGYQGEAIVKITGGDITATGGAAGPGIGNGALGATTVSEGTKNVRVGAVCIETGKSVVIIEGGNVEAYGGASGAGIGSGNACDETNVIITGGTVLAVGGASSRSGLNGAAGIGSGTRSTSDKPGYYQDTSVSVSISGGTVTAIGGWGAAGIGSGAANRMADSISITGGDVQAYADGTKFAIDTRLLDGEETTSVRAGRDITVPVVQGTFVHNGDIDGTPQNPEGLPSIQLMDASTENTVRELTLMPKGYRSFAASVSDAATYTVWTDSASIGAGEGRYFSKTKKDEFNKAEVKNTGILMEDMKESLFSDNFYLYPVRTVVVEKEVQATEGADLSGLNTEVAFSLVSKNTGEAWGDQKSIRIVNGKAQGRAYFVDVPDAEYDIVEMNGSESMEAGTVFGAYTLESITARSSSGSNMNGTISDSQWTDRVTVVNTYSEYRETPEPTPETTPEPVPEPTPTTTPEPAPEPTPTATPEPAPEPAPTATPEPTSEPVPEPTPTTTPESTPEPIPTATSEPTPEPAPEPAPVPARWRVTVNYWYNRINGERAAAAFTGLYATGDPYRINSPHIAGWTVDVEQVTGTMGTQDVVYHVIYTPVTYHLTIRYMDLEGHELAPSYGAELAAETDYSVSSPVIEGYHTDRPLVSGTMPARDVEVIVFYTTGTYQRRNVTWTVLESYDTPLGVGTSSKNAGEAVE